MKRQRYIVVLDKQNEHTVEMRFTFDGVNRGMLVEHVGKVGFKTMEDAYEMLRKVARRSINSLAKLGNEEYEKMLAGDYQLLVKTQYNPPLAERPIIIFRYLNR